MYYDKKPDPNLGLAFSPTEVFKNIREFKESLYEDQENKRSLLESAKDAEYKDAAIRFNDYIMESRNRDADRYNYLSKLKNSLVSESLFHIYKNSYSGILTESDKRMAKIIIDKFVLEHGAGNLINDFGQKNFILSEVSRICDKYYYKALESYDSCNDDADVSIKVNDEYDKDFYEELEDIDIADASKMIRDKVSDSVTEFIDSNVAAKLDYQEVLDAAKDQIDSTKEESYVEDISSRAKRRIVEMENARIKNVFHCIVESLTKNVLKNDDLKAKYVTESKIDMESITNTAQVMYTMLEMCNTLDIITIDEAFIADYIKNLNK